LIDWRVVRVSVVYGVPASALGAIARRWIGGTALVRLTDVILAAPGTVVHAALGHIDWAIVGVFAATSAPLSFVGARVALRRTPSAWSVCTAR
jgi:uncharacterized membrane protein YfcA